MPTDPRGIQTEGCRESDMMKSSSVAEPTTLIAGAISDKTVQDASGRDPLALRLSPLDRVDDCCCVMWESDQSRPGETSFLQVLRGPCGEFDVYHLATADSRVLYGVVGRSGRLVRARMFSEGVTVFWPSGMEDLASGLAFFMKIVISFDAKYGGENTLCYWR